MNLADELLLLRLAQKYNKQETFSKLLRISCSHYRKLETGRATFTRKTLFMIRLHFPKFGKTEPN